MIERLRNAWRALRGEKVAPAWAPWPRDDRAEAVPWFEFGDLLVLGQQGPRMTDEAEASLAERLRRARDAKADMVLPPGVFIAGVQKAEILVSADERPWRLSDEDLQRLDRAAAEINRAVSEVKP